MCTKHPNIVFLVAHPDDVAFTFGGTAWLLKDRYKLHVLCCTQGDRGYTWTGPGHQPPSPQVAAQRAQEEADACALLGAELTFLGLSDGEIFAGREICQTVADALAALKPVALFTHGPLEKPDHSAAFAIATRALHMAGLFWTTELYMPVDLGVSFNAKYPDVCVNISPVIEHKRELIRCHKHHIKSEADVETWIANNRMLGKLAWCDFVEGYMSGLVMVAERWKRKAGSILMELPVSGHE